MSETQASLPGANKPQTVRPDAPARAYFAPRRLGHANLFVGNYERAFEFYNAVAGFNEVYRQPDNMASFVSNGNTYHDLGLTDVRSRYAALDQKPDIWHLAFEVETEADLVHGYRESIDDGLEYSFTADHDAAHSVYLHDPDGNMVEVYADVVRDWWTVRHGVIIKEKPEWVPGVTNPPSKERNYPIDPEIKIVDRAVFHAKRITNIAVVAKDFEGMFRFYRDRVGLKPIVGNDDATYALLNGTSGFGDFALFRQRPGLKPGMHHVGFQVWGEDDLDRSVAALPAKGIMVERDVDHPARRSVSIRDPDGLLLQFHVERDWTPATIATLDAETALYVL